MAPRIVPTIATRFVQKARRGTAMKNRSAASEMKMAGAVRKLIASLTALMAPISSLFGPLYSGPEMPPSLRTLQKWTAIRMPATSGMPTQCRT